VADDPLKVVDGVTGLFVVLTNPAKLVGRSRWAVGAVNAAFVSTELASEAM
jgi:hypothetical protein